MIRIVTSAVFGIAVATLSGIPAANAGNNWNHYYGNSNGDAVAAGLVGLAMGAIIGGILAQPTYRSPVYADPYRYQRLGPVGGYYANGYYANGYYQEPVYVRRSLQPWSRAWYNYCRNRYRSFNPRSGTFLGYDGHEHFCTGG